MIDELKEIERICKAIVTNTTLISDPSNEGIKCKIDHGDGVSTEDQRSFKRRDFNVTIDISAEKGNWASVLKNALTIEKTLMDHKEHKWVIKDIERLDNTTGNTGNDYALRLNVLVFYHLL